jgi:hypothetical protein
MGSMGMGRILTAAAALWLGGGLALPATGQAQEDEVLREKVEILAEEVARLKEQMALPTTEEERLTGRYGMGPLASKVYGVPGGVSVGGYGEFHFAASLEEGAADQADFYRFIAYLGYKFSDRIVMNTEIEFEHATTEESWAGESGTVSVEFAYLDFLLDESFNVRAGNLLVPMGFVNVLHEPPFYRGNFRPEVERRIIPSTWRELGLGAHGAFGEGFSYTAYALTGLNGAGFSDRGVRGGRQNGNHALFNDVGLVGALEYDHRGLVQVGASAYTGGADHDGIPFEEPFTAEVSNTLWEIHGQLRHRGLAARALFTRADLDGAEDLTAALYPATDPDEDRLVPATQQGWYVDVAYDLAPLLVDGPSFSLSPWFRYEELRLQDEVPSFDGRAADPARDQRILTVGLEAKPHPQVVLKLDWIHATSEADDEAEDTVALGAGFAF